MTISIDIATLMPVMITLLIAVFAGAWAILRTTIYNPLDKLAQSFDSFRGEIKEEVSSVKDKFSELYAQHDVRIELIEFQLDKDKDLRRK